MEARRVALVTGASRGIGAATAIAFARDGCDLVLTARNPAGGTTFAGSAADDPVAGHTHPGSLELVAGECRDLGAQVAMLPLDLTSRGSVESCAADAPTAFGRLDIVVDNAVYQGPGLMDRAADVPPDLVAQVMLGDALHPFLLVQRLLPTLLLQPDPVVVHLTSGAATLDPRPAGAWGIGYAMAKAAAHRIVGVLHAELADRGLRSYNLNPGHVQTDVTRRRAELAGRPATGDSPEGPARAIAWLVAGSPEARALAGTEVFLKHCPA